MKVLVVGSGGRCHAIIDALSRSQKVDNIFAAPGNAGMAQKAECISIKDTEIEKLKTFALNEKIDLTIVGPESALALGIVDLFEANNLCIFGPNKAATQIESSKEFAKELMQKYNIPTAEYSVFQNYDAALSYCHKIGLPFVIKYDGLAAGKGVVIPECLLEAENTLKDMLLNAKFGEGRVVIESFLEGPEFSFMCFVNGDKVYPMELAQDHKRAFEGDKGPNTGGMGAYSPVPFITEEDKAYTLQNIMQATASALVEEGCPFKGVLYGGLIKTKTGIQVIEFNARFGDPETEVVLPRLKSDIVDAFMGVACNQDFELVWSQKAALGIVLATKGYPGAYQKGFPIHNLETQEASIFHMGTQNINGEICTNGGRVLFVTALADSLKEAQEKALNQVQQIQCDQLFYRKDIGWQAIRNNR